MPGTYESIATANGTGSAGAIDFTNIPSTYTDLVLVSYCTTTAQINLGVTFNGDTGGNYSRVILTSDPGGSTTTGSTNIAITGNGISTTSKFCVNITNIMRYADTSIQKTLVTRSSNASVGVDIIVGRWNSTNAINQVTIGTSSNTFSTSSTFTLYGIKAA